MVLRLILKCVECGTAINCDGLLLNYEKNSNVVAVEINPNAEIIFICPNCRLKTTCRFDIFYEIR